MDNIFQVKYTSNFEGKNGCKSFEILDNVILKD